MHKTCIYMTYMCMRIACTCACASMNEVCMTCAFAYLTALCACVHVKYCMCRKNDPSFAHLKAS